MVVARMEGVVSTPGVKADVDPRLGPAAHEFEACLMKEFLKPLEKDPLFGSGTDENDSEGSSSALMSFGSQALAQAISERGGFGIAQKIIGSVEAEERAKEPGTAKI